MQAVEQCLKYLLKGQREVRQQCDGELSPSLVLAESLFRYQKLQDNFSTTPFKNVVVIGPTQAGKSTIVNWLAGEQVAVADALAGFTRHAQGFSQVEITAEIQESLSGFFEGWEKLEQRELSKSQSAAWSLQAIGSRHSAFDGTIIWDTPDFDSVSARTYRNVAMKMLAIADVVVFMVSKEKYADETVWQTLKTLQPLRIPLLICLNKTPDSAAQEILPELDNRLQEANLQAAVVTIPYLEDMQQASEYEESVKQATQKLLTGSRKQGIEDSVSALARKHWDEWALGANAENQQHDQWQQLIHESLEHACQHYEKNYLLGSQYEATLQKAMVRLLELLEVPGIAESLVHARKLLTWPARKLRGVFSDRQSLVKGNSENLDAEKVILSESLMQLLISLQHGAGKNMTADSAQEKQWWKNIFNAIEAQKKTITGDFETQIEQYQQAFSPEIDAAAQTLYAHLEKNPAKLNSLRAARVTTDAAAVVFALKTGGIGLNDLVLTPAMLSFVSLLTEGALGKYMQGVEKKLKQSQKQAVCAGLIHESLKQRLGKIELQMSRRGLYNVPGEMLVEAEKRLGISHESI